MSIDASGRETLLRVARDAIGHGLVHAEVMEIAAGDYPPPLRAIACTFVTLHMGAALRGCIGSLKAHRPLVADVARHAHAAAFSDARFPSLEHTELASVHIHVSILSALESVPFDSDQALLEALRPGVDGLLIQKDGQRATFLPSVWSSFSDGPSFLGALKKKAGMPTRASDYTAWRYTTQDFEEPKA